jgi:hypothetical protein
VKIVNIPVGDADFCTDHELATIAHAPVVTVEVAVDSKVAGVPIQLQALEIRADIAAFWLATQDWAAYVGIIETETLFWAKVLQKDCADWRRPGICVALIARRQLSAAQSPAAILINRRAMKAKSMVAGVDLEKWL